MTQLIYAAVPSGAPSTLGNSNRLDDLIHGCVIGETILSEAKPRKWRCPAMAARLWLALGPPRQSPGERDYSYRRNTNRLGWGKLELQPAKSGAGIWTVLPWSYPIRLLMRFHKLTYSSVSDDLWDRGIAPPNRPAQTSYDCYGILGMAFDPHGNNNL